MMKRSPIAVLCLAIAACSGEGDDQPRLDADKIEAAIRAGMAESGLPLAEITCPPHRVQTAGDSFACPAVTQDGQKLAIVVAESADAGLSFHTPMIVTPTKIAARLAEKKLTDVRCAHPAMFVSEDAPVTCDARSDGKPVRLEFQAKKGGLSWVVKE